MYSLDFWEEKGYLVILKQIRCVQKMTKYFFFNFPIYPVDVLWGQPIKQNQVASTSELHENQRNDLLFFEIVPCHFCRASEVQT